MFGVPWPARSRIVGLAGTRLMAGAADGRYNA